jgi:ATP-dependent Lhr-like helicase
MVSRPPHIVVTTPESLYILLTSEGGRRLLGTVRTVIVDEVHALVGGKRGSHLSLSLARLDALTGRPAQRIGLSATQRPIERVARYLVGRDRTGAALPCSIVDSGHLRDVDLAIELPKSPLEAEMAGEVWEELYDRLAGLIREHRTTLVFVNTRRTAERVTRRLSERLSADAVTSHHGSLSKEHRFDAEQRLKAGKLRALVATASLELGIDIGSVDLVCQVGSTRSIASLLQRVGRAGHHLGGVSRGRLFPLSRDDLVECAALLLAVRRGDLDRVSVPEGPLDILAQQVVAAAAAGEWAEDDLFALMKTADPYAALPREDFDAVVKMLADGFSTPGRTLRGCTDGVREVRGRRGSRLVAITGRRIPDNADYVSCSTPPRTVGSVNETSPSRAERRHLPTRQCIVENPARLPGVVRSRMRAASRPRFHSGSVRRRAAPVSFHTPCRISASRSAIGSPRTATSLRRRPGSSVRPVSRKRPRGRSPNTWRRAQRRSAPCRPKIRS